MAEEVTRLLIKLDIDAATYKAVMGEAAEDAAKLGVTFESLQSRVNNWLSDLDAYRRRMIEHQRQAVKYEGQLMSVKEKNIVQGMQRYYKGEEKKRREADKTAQAEIRNHQRKMRQLQREHDMLLQLQGVERDARMRMVTALPEPSDSRQWIQRRAREKHLERMNQIERENLVNQRAALQEIKATKAQMALDQQAANARIQAIQRVREVRAMEFARPGERMLADVEKERLKDLSRMTSAMARKDWDTIRAYHQKWKGLYRDKANTIRQLGQLQQEASRVLGETFAGPDATRLRLLQRIQESVAKGNVEAAREQVRQANLAQAAYESFWRTRMEMIRSERDAHVQTWMARLRGEELVTQKAVRGSEARVRAEQQIAAVRAMTFVRPGDAGSLEVEMAKRRELAEMVKQLEQRQWHLVDEGYRRWMANHQGKVQAELELAQIRMQAEQLLGKGFRGPESYRLQANERLQQAIRAGDTATARKLLTEMTHVHQKIEAMDNARLARVERLGDRIAATWLRQIEGEKAAEAVGLKSTDRRIRAEAQLQKIRTMRFARTGDTASIQMEIQKRRELAEMQRAFELGHYDLVERLFARWMGLHHQKEIAVKRLADLQVQAEAILAGGAVPTAQRAALMRNLQEAIKRGNREVAEAELANIQRLDVAYRQSNAKRLADLQKIKQSRERAQRLQARRIAQEVTPAGPGRLAQVKETEEAIMASLDRVDRRRVSSSNMMRQMWSRDWRVKITGDEKVAAAAIDAGVRGSRIVENELRAAEARRTSYVSRMLMPGVKAAKSGVYELTGATARYHNMLRAAYAEQTAQGRVLSAARMKAVTERIAGIRKARRESAGSHQQEMNQARQQQRAWLGVSAARRQGVVGGGGPGRSSFWNPQGGAAGRGTGEGLNTLRRATVLTYHAYVKWLLLQGAFAAAWATFTKFAFTFNVEMEQAKVGIAGVLTSVAQLRTAQGDLLEGTQKFAAAQGLAGDAIERIKQRSLASVVTFKEVVQTMQAITGAGLRAGMSLEQIAELAELGTIATRALGLATNQTVQEMRDLVQGGIQPQSSALAVSLGITDKMVKKWRATGELYDELKKRLQGFALAGEAAINTLANASAKLGEIVQRLGAQAFEGMYQRVKQIVIDLRQEFLVWSEEQEKLVIRPEVIKKLEEVSKAVEPIVPIMVQIGRTVLGVVLNITKFLATHGKWFAYATALLTVRMAFRAVIGVVKALSRAIFGSLIPAFAAQRAAMIASAQATSLLSVAYATMKMNIAGVALALGTLVGGWLLASYIERTAKAAEVTNRLATAAANARKGLVSIEPTAELDTTIKTIRKAEDALGGMQMEYAEIMERIAEGVALREAGGGGTELATRVQREIDSLTRRKDALGKEIAKRERDLNAARLRRRQLEASILEAGGQGEIIVGTDESQRQKEAFEKLNKELVKYNELLRKATQADLARAAAAGEGAIQRELKWTKELIRKKEELGQITAATAQMETRAANERALRQQLQLKKDQVDAARQLYEEARKAADLVERTAKTELTRQYPEADVLRGAMPAGTAAGFAEAMEEYYKATTAAEEKTLALRNRLAQLTQEYADLELNIEIIIHQKLDAAAVERMYQQSVADAQKRYELGVAALKLEYAEHLRVSGNKLWADTIFEAKRRALFQETIGKQIALYHQQEQAYRDFIRAQQDAAQQNRLAVLQGHVLVMTRLLELEEQSGRISPIQRQVATMRAQQTVARENLAILNENIAKNKQLAQEQADAAAGLQVADFTSLRTLEEQIAAQGKLTALRAEGAQMQVQRVGLEAELALTPKDMEQAYVTQQLAAANAGADIWKKSQEALVAWELAQMEEMHVAKELREAYHQERMAAIHAEWFDKKWAKEQQALALVGQIAGQSAAIMSDFYESTGRKSMQLFNMMKAMRIAETIINTATAVMTIMKTWSDQPWIAGPLVAATSALGAAQVALIAATAPRAHKGIDYVPEDQTMVLKRGEMVIDPGTSEAVRRAALAGTAGGGQNNISVTVNVPIHSSVGPDDIAAVRANAYQAAHAAVSMALRDDRLTQRAVRRIASRR